MILAGEAEHLAHEVRQRMGRAYPAACECYAPLMRASLEQLEAELDRVWY